MSEFPDCFCMDTSFARAEKQQEGTDRVEQRGAVHPRLRKEIVTIAGSPHKAPDSPPPLASGPDGTRRRNCVFSTLMAMIFCQVRRGHSEPPRSRFCSSPPTWTVR